MGLFSKKDWRDPYRLLPDHELLERIRTGDPQAENYLWVTYHPIVSVHMETELGRYGHAEQLGGPGDYAHDAILLVLQKAHLIGSAVFKHDYTTLKGWLKQTATYFMQATIRNDRRHDRSDWPDNDTTDEKGPSPVASIAEEGAEAFADMTETNRDERIYAVLNALPNELQTLIRLKFMEGYSWRETSDLMLRLYPGHKPPFELAYLQKTYWDRVHKKPFIKRLSDDLDDLLP